MKFVSRTKKHLAKSAAAVGSLVATGSAMASEPATAAASAFAELEAQVAEFVGYAWPVVAAVVGSLLAIGLFKKFANKAT